MAYEPRFQQRASQPRHSVRPNAAPHARPSAENNADRPGRQRSTSHINVTTSRQRSGAHATHSAQRPRRRQTLTQNPRSQQRRSQYVHNQQTRRNQPRKQPTRLPFVPLAIALVLVVALAAFLVSTCSKQESSAPESTTNSTSTSGASTEARASYFATIQGNPEAIHQAANSIPAGNTVQSFCLSSQAAPVALTAQQLQEIENALNNYYGSVGFAVINLDSGRGICRNADEALFGASSYKAAYAAYLCSQLVEENTLSLDTSVPDGATYWNPVSPNEWANPYCVGGLIQNAVILSDNDAYESLRAYDYLGHSAWLHSMGLEDLLYCERSWYPNYSAAQGFNLWANIYSYLQGGTQTAQWLKAQLGNTEVSFLRSGLGNQATAVWDKAGWDDDIANGYTAMTDCGIVEANGHAYLVVLLTTMAGVEENFPYAYDLVKHAIGPCIQALS